MIESQLTESQLTESQLTLSQLTESQLTFDWPVAARYARPTNRFGLRPRFARGILPWTPFTAARFSSPAALPWIGTAVCTTSHLSWSGVSDGRACTSNARAPDTTGAAAEVPLSWI